MPKYFTVSPSVLPDFVEGVFDMMDMMDDILPFAIQGAKFELEHKAPDDPDRHDLQDLVDRLELVKEELEERKEERHGN